MLVLLLRYYWPVPHVANHCACGLKNSVNHPLSCKKGGFVTLHDVVVKTETELLCWLTTVVHICLITSKRHHNSWWIKTTGLSMEKWKCIHGGVRIIHGHPNTPSNMQSWLIKSSWAERKTKYQHGAYHMHSIGICSSSSHNWPWV